MEKYVELEIGPIVEDSCAWADLAFQNVFGRNVVIVADIDQNHQLYRVDKDLILSKQRATSF